MDNNSNKSKNRRGFLSSLISRKEKQEMVKLLTADGKLVEVEKSVYEAAFNKAKATNKDIYDWMQNPSKKNS